MSYKMILNILILFLCTSCLCANSDDCSNDIDPFYISIKDKHTGHDMLITHNIKKEEIFLTDDKGNDIKNFAYITTDSVNSFITIFIQGYYRNGNNQFLNLRLKNLNIGDFNITLKPSQKTYCCTANKVDKFEVFFSTVSVASKPQEKNQPFYEIKF